MIRTYHVYLLLAFLSSVISTKTMSKLKPELLLAKFRGTLLGVLVGDCCGLEFEWNEPSTERSESIQRRLDRLESEQYEGPIMEYSDDTAMTKVLAETLVNGYNQKDLTKNFVTQFFSEYDRGYGPAIPILFDKLKESNFSDIKKPAQEQFYGFGSFGNGGAMRISPVALYCLNEPEKLQPLVQEVTEVTHTNILGINGALLEAMAIHQALLIDPNEQDLDPIKFCNELLTKMEQIEAQHYQNPSDMIYTNKLKAIGNFLLQNENPSIWEIIKILGNGVEAQNSVPTAIYCFLRSHKPSILNETLNHPSRNTLQYAIELGGDSDTIAAMACAIAGALYGDTGLPENILNHLESLEAMKNLADNLFRKVTNVQN